MCLRIMLEKSGRSWIGFLVLNRSPLNIFEPIDVFASWHFQAQGSPWQGSLGNFCLEIVPILCARLFKKYMICHAIIQPQLASDSGALRGECAMLSASCVNGPPSQEMSISKNWPGDVQADVVHGIWSFWRNWMASGKPSNVEPAWGHWGVAILVVSSKHTSDMFGCFSMQSSGKATGLSPISRWTDAVWATMMLHVHSGMTATMSHLMSCFLATPMFLIAVRGHGCKSAKRDCSKWSKETWAPKKCLRWHLRLNAWKP